MKTVHTRVAREMLDGAADIFRRIAEGSPMTTRELNARIDGIKDLVGTATDQEIDRELDSLRAMGGDGGGP